MPDRRRPRLWKTLVAAGRTAIDRVADGVDVLADGAEAVADGLRSLARRLPPAPPPPPLDPRLAGVDPALAAYVAARDPVWFSFDISDTLLAAEAGAPPSPWPEASPQAEQTAPLSPAASDTAEPPPPRRPTGRGAPSAAELPGGRPLPPRVLFRRRRNEPDVPSPSRPSTARPGGAHPGPHPTQGSDAGAGPSPVTPPRRIPAARGPEPVSAAPAARQVPPAPRAPAVADSNSAGERRSTPEDSRSAAPLRTETRAPAPFPTVAFQSRSASAGRASGPGSDSPAATRRPSFERPEQDARTPPRRPFPAPAGLPPTATQAPQDRRASAPPIPPVARTREPTRAPAAAAPSPAPWPELPPSSWSPIAGDAGGILAWAAASGSDVLVDEQRST